MDYWKSKLLPKIKKVFEKNGKKAAAAEACKSFDESKVAFVLPMHLLAFLSRAFLLPLLCTFGLVQEEIDKEFEEKKTELQPKVVEIYEASSAEIKVIKASSIHQKIFFFF